MFGDLYPFRQGAFAEYVAAPERAFAAIPEGMPFETAATLPHSAILAIQGLRRRDGRTVGPGDRVLIDGASGNVGPFAVQIAKARGAEVTGVCSTAKVEFVRSLGVDHVLDYRATDYTATGERYDWIVDTDSHHPISRIRRALRPGGTYVTLGGSGSGVLKAMVVGPAASLASNRSMGLMLWWKPFESADVATLLDSRRPAGQIPAIDRRYPLAEVVEALRRVDAGQALGKVIITVCPACRSGSTRVDSADPRWSGAHAPRSSRRRSSSPSPPVGPLAQRHGRPPARPEPRCLGSPSARGGVAQRLSR